MTTEGPLAKLSRLLGLKALAPIPQVKRIEESPVSLNPETLLGNKPLCIGNDPLCPCQDGDACHYRDTPNSPAMPFKMAPTPNDMSDTGIHRLYGDRLKRSPRARQYDLSFDYASYRPTDKGWICVDLNTYDGAYDAEAPCNFIGRGASEKEARMNLLEQFQEYDNLANLSRLLGHDNPEPAPKPRPSRVIHSSPFEPPTYADERGEDYDE